MLVALIAATLMQPVPAGPVALPGDPTAVPSLPPRPRRGSAQQIGDDADAAQDTRLGRCLAVVGDQPADALSAAESWARQAQGGERAQAAQCRAFALVQLSRYAEAETAFTAARDLLPATDGSGRARFAASAAIAAESAGQHARALVLYDLAAADAAGDQVLAGRIARERAGSLFRLDRRDEAAASLAAARAALPDDAVTWLLSARLARLEEKLGEAQTFVERAAALAPADPAVGLEAGKIAVLVGRDEAARRSWQSVVALAPQSEEADLARRYLSQLGPTTPAPAAEPASR